MGHFRISGKQGNIDFLKGAMDVVSHIGTYEELCNVSLFRPMERGCQGHFSPSQERGVIFQA